MHVVLMPAEYSCHFHPFAGVFCTDQAKALAQAGHQVSVLYFQQLSLGNYIKFLLSKEITSGHERQDGVDIYRKYSLNVPKLSRFFHLFGSRKMFKSLVANSDKKVDIIHAHFCIWSGVSAVRIGAEFNTPVTITEHATAYFRNLYSKRKLACAKDSFLRANECITVSNFLAETVNEKVQGKIPFKVIPNMVDVEFFKDDGRAKNEDFTFFALSFLSEVKEIPLMIRSFKSHVKKYPNSKLVIGGQGPLMEQLQTQIAQLELERNVNLKGWMDKRAIKDQMLRSHAFVHSSRVETFGVVLIEAMSCGLPIVATRSGGPQEFVKAEHGYLVDVGDQERLSESLNKMVENYSDFDRVAISKYVNENFSAQGISERLGELYRSITD